MKRETAYSVSVESATGLPACEYFDKGPTTPAASPSPGTGALSIAVAPDPLKILWVCPIADTYCYGSLDSTVTVTETAGGGRRGGKRPFHRRAPPPRDAAAPPPPPSPKHQSEARAKPIRAEGQPTLRPSPH